MKASWTGTLALVTLMALTARASAGDPGATQQSAAAVALFKEAQKLAAAGNHAAACPKFAEVRRTLPTAGLHLNLGDCYEHLGKLASAWGAFTEAEIIARNGRDPDRQAEAQKRARAIEGKLSKLTISVGSGERLSGLTVKRDGEPIGEGQWGSAVPVDAGDHVVEVSAPGHRSWSTHVAVGANAASVSVAVPRLPKEEAPPPPPPPASWWSGQRVAGVSVAGAGAVGLVVGAIFGARGLGKNADSKEQCSPANPNLCTDTGVSLREDAKAAGSVSTGALIAGGVLLAGGVVLVVTAPSAKAREAARFEVGPRVSSGELGLVVGGRW